MRVAVLALVAGCGRFDFGELAGRDARGDAVVDPDATSVDFIAAMPCETDIDVGAVSQAVDQLVWSDFGARQVVFAIHHLDSTHHEIHAHVLGVVDAHVMSIADVTSYAAPDLTGLAVVNASVLLVHDVGSNVMRVITVDGSFAHVEDHLFTSLTDAFVPYARAGAAQMVVGVDAAGVVAYAVDDTLAVTGGPYMIGPAADAPTYASIGTVGAAFAIGWTATASGACKFVRVGASGAATSPVLTVAAPCSYGAVVGLGNGDAVYTMRDQSAPQAYGGAIPAAFNVVTTPKTIAASDSQPQTAIDATSRGLVAVRTTGDSDISAIATDGTIAMVGADFGLSGNDADSETIHMLGGAYVHARSEGGMLHVRKLCR